MEGLASLPQFLLVGLTLGSIYALVAIGFVLIYNVTGVINFTQGEFCMLGAMLSVTFVRQGIHVVPAALLAVAAVVLFGALLERAAINPARKATPLTLIFITLGAATSIRGVALLFFGTEPYTLPIFHNAQPLRLAGATVTWPSLTALAVAIVVVFLLFLLLERTMTGKALRACMVNKLAAQLMGINPQLMSLLAFTLSAAVGAVAGIIITPITLAVYDMGLMLSLKGFIAATLGGLASAPGAIVGGLLLGVLEALGAGYIGSGYKDVAAFLALLVVLFVRPDGIIGAIRGERV
ncbi:MAG: branched-chain amino acid ABC transporter permease [Firmicutes bacterium]|nr:branched-chain amino acid ABC transporter permease [Bacillota bacterium]